MRPLYDAIKESINDDDDQAIGGAMGDAIISQLDENGIHYAHGRYIMSSLKSKFEGLDNDIVSYSNGELSFYSDRFDIGSEVAIDYLKAKKFLGSIRAIHAPSVIFYNIGSHNIENLPLVYACRMVIQDAYDTVRNVHFKYEEVNTRIFELNSTRIADMDGCYKTIMGGPASFSYKGIYISSYASCLNLVNCTFLTSNRVGCMLKLGCDNFTFNGVRSDFYMISVYDPGLFDKDDLGGKIMSLFDPDHEFKVLYNGASETRRTRTIGKLLAFFGNRKYANVPLSDDPYRVVGSSTDVVNLSGFTYKQLRLYIYDNNYFVDISKDDRTSQRLFGLQKKYYMKDGGGTFDIQTTTDGYNVVVGKRLNA